MGVGVQWGAVLFFALGLGLLYLLGWLLLVPFRKVLGLLGNALLGGAALVALNLLAPATGLFMAVNPITALIAGVLGIPGVVLIALFSAIF